MMTIPSSSQNYQHIHNEDRYDPCMCIVMAEGTQAKRRKTCDDFGLECYPFLVVRVRDWIEWVRSVRLQDGLDVRLPVDFVRY